MADSTALTPSTDVTMTPPAAPPAPVPAPAPAPVDAPLLNDNQYVSVFQNQDGQQFRVRPTDIDSAVRSGLQPVNPDKTFWVQQSSLMNPIPVPGSQLPSVINNGYSAGGSELEHYQAKRERYAAQTTPAPVDSTWAEKAIALPSAVASGATFGATDVFARGLEELIGSIQGNSDWGKESAEQLRSVRDSLGYGDVAAQMLGGLISGGALVGLGKSALAKIGLSAVEGALSGVGMTASRQALADPNVTAESYLMNAGIGSLLGGGLGGLTELAGKMVPRTLGTTRMLEAPEFKLGDEVLSLKGSAPSEATVPFYHDGKLVGTADIASFADAYHPGGKAGYTLEDLHLVDGAPKGSEYGVMKSLTDELGAISSPSKLEDLDGDVAAMFKKYGAKHTTADGDNWYQATPSTLPIQGVKEGAVITGLAKKFYKAMGRWPDENEPNLADAMDKIFDPDHGLYRKDFVKFEADPTEDIGAARKTLEELDSVAANYVDEGQKALMGLKGSSVNIKPEVAAGGDQLAQLASVLKESYNPEASDAVTSVAKMAKDVIGAKEGADAVAKVNAFRGALTALPDSLGSVSEEMAQEIKKISMNILKKTSNVDHIDPAKAVELNDLVKRVANARSRIDRAFKESTGVPGERVVSESKVQEVLQSFKGRAKDRMRVVDDSRADLEQLGRTLNDLKEQGVSNGVEGLESLSDRLNRLNTIREYATVSKAMEKTNEGNFLSNAAQSGTAMLGSIGGAGAAAMFGFSPLQHVASWLGAEAASRGIKQIGNPRKMIELAAQSNGTQAKLADAVETALAAYQKGLRTAAPAINKATILSTLRAQQMKNSRDPNEFVNNANQRLKVLANPAFTKNATEELHPTISQAISSRASAIANYALAQSPQPASGQRISMAEANKYGNVLLAVTHPEKALQQALQTKDFDLLKHWAAMYPSLYAKVTGVASKGISTDDSYSSRVNFDKMLGTNFSGTSTQTTNLVQAVFSDQKEEAPEGMNVKGISQPPELPGSRIQRR